MNRRGIKKGFTLIELLIVIAIIAILALIAIPNFMEAQTRAKVSRAMSDMRSIATALEAYFVDSNAYPVFNNVSVVGGWSETYYQTHPNPYAWFLWIKNVVPGDWYEKVRIMGLTTPIAYMTTRAPDDPFEYGGGPTEPTARPVTDVSYFYYNFQSAGMARHHAGAAWCGSGGSTTNAAPVVGPAPMVFNGGGKRFDAQWALVSVGPSRQHEPNAVRNMLYDVSSWNQMINGKIHVYDPTNGTVSVGSIWRLSSGNPAER